MEKNNSLLKKIELFEKLSIYGKRSSFLNKLAQDNQVGNIVSTVSIPGDIPPVTPKTPSSQKLAVIPKDVQKKLSDECIHAGLIGPTGALAIDGVIGNKTREALDKYKIWKYLDERKTDAEVITDLKLQIETDKVKAQGAASTNLNPVIPEKLV